MKAHKYKRRISPALVSFRDVKDDLVTGGASVASAGYIVTMVQNITGHQRFTGHQVTSGESSIRCDYKVSVAVVTGDN